MRKSSRIVKEIVTCTKRVRLMLDSHTQVAGLPACLLQLFQDALPFGKALYSFSI